MAIPSSGFGMANFHRRTHALFSEARFHHRSPVSTLFSQRDSAESFQPGVHRVFHPGVG
jgi:hypothetical protein